MGRHRKKQSKAKSCDNNEELESTYCGNNEEQLETRNLTAEKESNEESGFEEEEEDEIELLESKKRSLEDHQEQQSNEKRRKMNMATLEELAIYATHNNNGQHSALLKMQLEELLKEINIKEKQKAQIIEWKNKFSVFISKIKNTSKFYKFDDLEWMTKKGLTLPLPTSTNWPKTNGTFIFESPTKVDFVGSFDSDTITTHTRTVDIALILPKTVMEKKDLLNCRWIMRRALYLCWLGKKLQKSDLVEDLHWIFQFGSPLRPVLQVTPKGSVGKKWKFNLFPIPPNNHFNLGNVAPRKSNVRRNWFMDKTNSEDNEEGNNDSSTPHYNWAMAVDIVMPQHQKFISDNITYKEWKDGIKLLKIWLSQRQLNGPEGISSHTINLLAVYLIKKRKINLQTHPYQVFRAFLLSLVQSDWLSNGLTLANEEQQAELSMSEFHHYYPVVFVDCSGHFNVVSNMQREAFKELQYECQKTLNSIECPSPNLFECLFIQKVDFLSKCDQLIKINLTKKTTKSIFENHVNDSKAKILDFLGCKKSSVERLVLKTLSEAFGDRIEVIVPLKDARAPVPFKMTPEEKDFSLTLGVCLNIKTFASILTKGPSADTAESKSFREFWGEKSSLRRFQDSSFHEAILWNETSSLLCDKRLVLHKIASYILNYQLGIPDKCIHFVGKQLENTIRFPAMQPELNYGTGEEANSSVILAFDSLSKKLRSLSLVLPITSVQSSSEVMRHSQVFVPMPKSVAKAQQRKQSEDEELKPNKSAVFLREDEKFGCPLYTSAIEMQLFLEVSGKWPDDVLAVNAMKIKFLGQIQDTLTKEGLTAVLFPTHLQILWEGFVFNVLVCYRREIHLKRMIDLPNGEFKEEDTEASIELEKNIELLPRLTSSLNSLQSEFASFSGSVRLVKRWCSCQMLLPNLPSVVVDLLVASLFVHPFPHKVPATPHTALIRFLSLVANTDWKSTPVIINFRGQLSALDQGEISRKFTNMRDCLPPLFIGSPFELRPIVDESTATKADFERRFKLLSCWTKTTPSVVVLNRLKCLAQTALQWYQTNLFDAKENDFKVLFRASLSDYNVVIHLNRKELATRNQNIDFQYVTKSIPFERSKHQSLPIVQFDPALKFLQELRDSYGSLALFFHCQLGGDVIGVVWKPKTLQVKAAKVSTIRGHKLCDVVDVKQVANIEAFIEDFKILGRGLVTQVTVNS